MKAIRILVVGAAIGLASAGSALASTGVRCLACQPPPSPPPRCHPLPCPPARGRVCPLVVVCRDDGS